MSTSVELLPGPLTSEASRSSAEKSLTKHPSIKKGSAYALEQVEGRWIAAIVHQAGPPPFAGGGPADAEEEAPAPKSEGPDDAEPSEGGDVPPPDGGDSDGESGPPKHEKGGEKAELHQVVQILHQIAEALGLPLGLGDPMGPGGDDMGGPPGGPPGPPGAPPGPPGAPPGPPGGPPGVQKVIHDRVTKPGETPPGGTPLGAPAFSSVRADHPWAHLIDKLASITMVSEIGETPIPEVRQNLESLASEVNYRVARLREDRDDEGNRVAVAVVTAH